jgi:hypothetical protein
VPDDDTTQLIQELAELINQWLELGPLRVHRSRAVIGRDPGCKTRHTETEL